MVLTSLALVVLATFVPCHWCVECLVRSPRRPRPSPPQRLRIGVIGLQRLWRRKLFIRAREVVILKSYCIMLAQMGLRTRDAAEALAQRVLA